MTESPSGEVLAHFWDLACDLLAISDLDGNLLYVNRRWEEVTGYTVDEIRLRSRYEFIHPDDRERTIREASDMAAQGRPALGFENRYVHRDGSVLWLRWNSFPSLDDQRVYGVATDITAERRAQSLLEVMARVASAANEADELAPALQTAVDEVCAATGWPVGHALLPAEADPEVLVTSGVWHLSDPQRFAAFRTITERTRFPPGQLLPGRALATGSPEWVLDLASEPEFVRGGALDVGLHAGFAVPVRSRQSIVAVLEFFSEEKQPPDPVVLDTLDKVGTQLGRVAERRAAVEAEQQALDVERRFLSMLTHELRNPVTAIKGLVELLRSHWEALSADKRREFLEQLGDSATTLTQLVEDFLELARQHADGFEPRLAPVDLAAHVTQAIGRLAEAVEGVEMDVPSRLVVTADADFLHQILVNLITNAQRYGEPPIQLTAERVADEVRISVRDHGPGVPAAFRPDLFEWFARADRSRPGTGLGLFIARELARAQGGDLTHTPAHPGARFTLTIPAPDRR